MTDDTSFADLLNSDYDWIQDLAPYQQETIEKALEAGHDLEQFAEMWLAGSGSDIAVLGASRSLSHLFYRKFVDEFYDLLCSPTRYQEERSQLRRQLQGGGQATVVVSISAWLSQALSAADALLAPAVAVMLAVIAKLGLNAWCKAMEERRDAATSFSPSAED